MGHVSAPDSADAKTNGRPTESIHISNSQELQQYHGLPAKPAIDATNISTASPDAGAHGADQALFQDHYPSAGKDQGSSAASLPPEILQHIFSFVDPISLGRLLFVNRLFNVLLDPTKTLPPPSASARALGLKPQNDLWISARRTFASTCPRPMEDMSEIEMWRLIRGISCQFCGKKPKNRSPLLAMAASPWSSGPGPEGVRTIWPFKCQSCGPCLESRIVKETEILLSSKSILLSGLPFALFTPSLNYVTSVTLRQTQPPPRLQLTKYYFQPQIDDLDQHQIEVRAFGAAALQEWYKGLDKRGQALIKECARFEQWQLGNPSPPRTNPVSMGLVNGSTSPAYSMASSAMYSHQVFMESPYRPFSAQSTPIYPGTPAGPQQHIPGTFHMPLQNHGLAPGQVTQLDHSLRSPFPTQHVGSGPATIQPSARPRQERNFQEIDSLKSGRRTEIRRRCLELRPPVQPSTLDFMDAYKAAVQIARPLTDNDWDILKNRLLAQRVEAEHKERQHNAAAVTSQVKTQERQNVEHQRRHAQETADRTWIEIQKPSRDKAREYADEYIKADWAEGRAVNKTSSGRFAADVLINVRRRYYETIEQEDTLLTLQSMTIPQDSPIHEIRRLKMEDMKFVYEETIRPRIDRFGREVFLCSTCEANAKRFTFDAVIQHYAAKHTSALSHGNAVVYWRADWPAEPPFHPTPDIVWNRAPEHRPMFHGFGATSPAYTPAYTPHPGASWMSPLAPGQPNGIYHVQCEELVASAKRIWDAIDDIRHLPSSLRVYVVIHQVAMSFSRRFTNEPTLPMFSECVNYKPLLTSLRDLTGLTCRACHTYGESSGDAAVNLGLPELLQHFQTYHIEYDVKSPQSHFIRPMPASSISAHRMDWKFDMVDLPAEAVIRGIIRLPGMDQQKLEMVAEVLPSYFPTPLPHIDTVPLTEEEYSPQRSILPLAREQAFSGQGHRTSFKRPLDEDQYSYPPSHRRLVEYDPYHPEAPSFDSYHANDRSRTYIEGVPQGRVVHVERGYPARPFRIEARPFPTPHAGLVRYAPARSTEDGTRPHIIREVLDDYSSEPRSRDRLPEPVPVSEEPRGRLLSPTRHQGDQYRSPDEVLSAAEHFLNTFDNISTRPYVDDAGPDVRFNPHSRIADRGSHSHATTPAQTPARSRQNEEAPFGHGPGSRRHSPRLRIPERLRSRNESPIPPLDSDVRTPEHEDYVFHPEDAVRLSNDKLALSPAHGHRNTRQGSLQRSPLRPGRDSSPRGEGAVPYEYDHYADGRSAMPRTPFYGQPPPSPELLYRPYEDRRPVKYIEILPSGQRRIVEELSSPTFERVEHTRDPHREPYYRDRGDYIVQYVQPPALSYKVERNMDRAGYARPPQYAHYEGGRNYSGYADGSGASFQDSQPPPIPEFQDARYVEEPYDDARAPSEQGR